MPDKITSFLIIGAGAIGTYLGVSLAQVGQRVVYLERKEDLPELQKRGLSLDKGGKILRQSHPELISELSQIRGQRIDLAITALKTYHLPALLPALASLGAELPPLLCLQNGVESEDLLAAALGREKVIPGTVTSAVDRLDKGKALLSKERGMGLAGSHPMIDRCLPIFNQAGLNCRYYRRAAPMKWSKLLINLLGNASAAILDLPTAAIYAHPGLYRVEREQIREGLRVMKRLGTPVTDLPGVPVRALSALVQYSPSSLSRPILTRLIGGGRGGKMPSFHMDLYSGKGKSEVDQLNGAVVRGGKKTGVSTPVNAFLARTLTSLIQGEIPLDRYRHDPDRFLQDLTQTRSETRFNG